MLIKREFIDTSPKVEDCIVGEVDHFRMPILGKITNRKNIQLLKQTSAEEMSFNDPSIAYEWVAKRYMENEEIHGKKLYEAELDLVFVDIDVFRQQALYYKQYGTYCPFDPEKDAAKYAAFWRLIMYRRKNGMTAYAGLNPDGTRRLVHCPGNLYGFLNFGPILKVADDDSIDNEKDFIDSATDVEELAAIKIETLLKNLRVRSTRIGRKDVDFPEFFDGQYHIAVAKNFARLIGKNFFLGKARRKGMSYFMGWDGFNHIDLNPNITVIFAAFDKKYLIHGKGLMKMAYTYADWVNTTTAFNKERLVSSKEHLQFGYRPQGKKEAKGYLSELLAVSAMNNADVTIGKDAYELAYEELGKFPNFMESYEVTTSTTEAGDYKTGMIAGWGTGGTDDANWRDFEKIMYQPDVVDALPCNNIWDEGKLGTASCYFYPHVQSQEGYMDYNGNTNYKASWEAFLAKKVQKKEATTDAVDFEKWCSQRANCPAEAFSRSSTNLYNREAIVNQLIYIRSNEYIRHSARLGKLITTNDGIRLVTNDEGKVLGLDVHGPVDDFPLKKDTDVHGCYREWIPPYVDPTTGLVPANLNIAFQDPYAHDRDKKQLTLRHSLGVTYWFERPNNITSYGGMMVLSSYVGRPPRMDDYNEQVLLGCLRNNSKLLFENDRGDTKQYFQKRKMLHLLFEEPEFQFNKDLFGKTGRGYGMHLNPARKAKGAIYLRDLLDTPITKGDNGDTKTLYNYIFDEGFLEELLRWSMDGNFDRVSAWIIGAFIIKELETNEIQAPKAAGQSVFETAWY